MLIQEKLSRLQEWALTGIRLVELPPVTKYGTAESELALLQYCYYRLIHHVAGNIIENPNYDVHELVDVFLSSPFGGCVSKEIVVSLCELLMTSDLRCYCGGTLFAPYWTAGDVAGTIHSVIGGTEDLLKAAIDDKCHFTMNHLQQSHGLKNCTPMNPWLNLSLANPKIAPCDVRVINSFKYINELQLQLFPEPFLGSPDARVYLLNGNPGYSQRDDLFINHPYYKNLCIDNYKHTHSSINDDFIYFNEIVGDDGDIHEGCKWWNKHTVQIRKILSRNPHFFNVEFFPYHSKNLSHIPRCPNFLPSYGYSNYLINKAISDGKIIVILRMEESWKCRIPALNHYNKVITLKNSRNVCITANNVGSCWLDLVNNL